MPDELIRRNREWAEGVRSQSPVYFLRLASRFAWPVRLNGAFRCALHTLRNRVCPVWCVEPKA